MDRYPVDLVVTSPARYDRVQIALRLGIALVLGFLGVSGGWVSGLLYVVLPVIAAVAIGSHGAAYYHERVGPSVWRVLRWLFDFSAYMMLLVDRFPTTEGTTCRVELEAGGTPTVGRALARLVFSIPAAIVQCVLWFISGIFVVVSWITVLAAETVPRWIRRYQEAVLRAQARLFAYHAALVDPYPPFSFGETTSGPALPTARTRGAS
jgi:hypothetical protein